MRSELTRARQRPLQALFTRKCAVSSGLVLLCRQKANIAKAGARLLRSVGSIAVGVSDTRPRAALLSATEFCRVVSRWPMPSRASQCCSIAYSSLLFRVGEAGGGLDRSFHELQRNLKRKLSKIRKVKAAVPNPTFVVVALVVSNTTLILALSRFLTLLVPFCLCSHGF